MRGWTGIDNDGKDIGVDNQSLLDVVPGLTAVRGFPWQVPGSGVNDFRMDGIDCQRLDFVNFAAALRADLRPCSTAVARTEDSGERSCIKNAWIGRRLYEGVHGLTAEMRTTRSRSRPRSWLIQSPPSSEFFQAPT